MIRTNIQNNTWSANLKTNGSMIKYKLDTGAMANIISHAVVKTLKNKPEIYSTKTTLRAYNNQKIDLVGKCSIDIELDQNKHTKEFLITKESFYPILGLDTCKDLNLLHQVDNIQTEFSDVFDIIGCIKDPYHINIDKSITPVVHSARRIPIALHAKLKEKLERMEKMSVI